MKNKAAAQSLATILLGLAFFLPATARGSFDINNATVTLTGTPTLSVSSDVVITNGLLAANTAQIVVGSTWTISGGTFSAGYSTVTFVGGTGGSYHIQTQGNSFANVIFNDPKVGSWVQKDTFTANGNLTLTSGVLDTDTNNNYAVNIASNVLINGGSFNAYRSTVTVSGSWTFTSGSFGGSGLQLFNATSPEAISAPTMSFGTLQFNGMGGSWTLGAKLIVSNTLTLTAGTLDSSSGNNEIVVSSSVFLNGGTFNLNASTMNVQGSWILTGTTFNADTSTVTFNGAGGNVIIPGGQPFNFLNINSSAGTWYLGAPLTTNAGLTVSSGTFDTSSSNYGITVSSDVNIASGVFNLNTSTVAVSGNWIFGPATFNSGTSTVTFQGASTSTSTLMGSTTFYNLASTVAGKTFQFAVGSTQTVSNLLTLTGASGNLLVVKSTSSGTQWYLKDAGTNAVSFVSARDSNASPGAEINDANGGVGVSNNVNWDFASPAAVTNLSALTGTRGGSINLTWTAPGDQGSVGVLNNSTFTIQYTTVSTTVFSPTSTPANAFTVQLATTGVNPATTEGYGVTGLTAGSTYYFRLWTVENLGNISGVSNGATTWAQIYVLSINLSGATTFYDFGLIAPAISTNSANAVAVTNDGNVTENYSMDASSTTDWTLGASTPTSTNVFVLMGAFHNVQPSTSSFTLGDVYTASLVAADASHFTIDGTETGLDIDPFSNSTRHLWFRLDTPTQSSSANKETSSVTIQATQSP